MDIKIKKSDLESFLAATTKLEEEDLISSISISEKGVVIKGTSFDNKGQEHTIDLNLPLSEVKSGYVSVKSTKVGRKTILS